jgi:hypothetical protein
MKFKLTFLRSSMGIISLIVIILNLTACVTYDPPPQESKPVPTQVDSWSHIPTKNWEGVNYEKRDEALTLLGKKDVVPISVVRSKELSYSPQEKSPVVPNGHKLYLVKGRGYGIFGGKIRFNLKTRELSVFLVAYNGEISIPGMRWAVEDIPLVVALPAVPSKVHKSAEIGGDSCFRFMDRD